MSSFFRSSIYSRDDFAKTYFTIDSDLVRPQEMPLAIFESENKTGKSLDIQSFDKYD